MPIRFADYVSEHSDAVHACNLRLAAGGVEPAFLLPAKPLDPSANEGKLIRARWRLALDGETVRGGYLLKTRRFLAGQSPVEAGGYQAPISEGIVDRKYATLGLQLLQDALRQNPYLFTTGMGGTERPVAKLLAARGFELRLVPFLFRIHRAGPFFRQVSAVRSTAARRATADILAATGLGWLTASALHWRRLRARPARPIQTEDQFGAWAEELWEQTKGQFSLIAERTPPVLNELYPKAAHTRIVRVPGAWAVTWLSEMRGNRHFGNLRVGTVLDCLTGPESATPLASAAAAVLEDQGADLILTNQTADFVIAGFEAAGFRRGPSNYGVSTSPALHKLSGNAPGPWHMTRGDGDGRVNL